MQSELYITWGVLPHNLIVTATSGFPSLKSYIRLRELHYEHTALFLCCTIRPL